MRASAAIPILLPPVRVGGRLYCDGSLRQHVPLSPARHLGATRIMVVTTQSTAPPSPRLAADREAGFPAPLAMLGRALEALSLDRLDEDLDRLERLNRILAAGERAFGERFLPRLNAALGPAEALRPIATVVVRPSEPLGRMAAEFVRAPGFRSIGGPLGRMFGRLADGEGEHEAELLSHLLFDGRFAAELMALGRQDARAHEDELAALFEGRARRRAREGARAARGQATRTDPAAGRGAKAGASAR